MTATCDESTPLITSYPQSPPPPPKWNVFFIMALFGLTYLIPFDMVFTANGYFRAKFSETGDETLILRFPCYFQAGGITTQVIMSLSSMIILKRVPIEPFVIGCNIVTLAIFVVMTIMSKVPTTTWPMIFFVLTTSMYCVACGAGAMYKSGVMAIASMLHPRAIQGFILGQSAAGAVNSLISLVTLSFPRTDVLQAGFCYLLTSCICLAVSLSVYILIFNKMRYVRNNTIRKAELVPSDAESLLDSSTSTTSDDETEKATFMGVLKESWQFCAANCISLIITLLLFPAAISNLQPSDPGKIPQCVYNIIIFMTFSVGDVLGALTSTFIALPKKLVLPFSILRLIFIPLIFMCNLQPRTVPVWFVPDYWPCLFYFTMAWSNGIVLSIAATYCATSVESKLAKSIAGTLSTFSCALGLVIGSLLVFPMLSLLK